MLSFKPATSHTILIGVSQFKDKKLYPLPSVENNVWELKRLFVEPSVMGMPCDNVTVIGNTSSAGEILPSLNQSLKKASDEHALETLIIYYAGHGLSPIRHARDESQDFFLATKDTESSLPLKWSNALSFRSLLDVVTNIGHLAPKLIIFILDCCFSARAIEQICAIENRDIFIITATSSIQKAIAPPNETYSIFTGELIKTLTKGIANKKDIITLADIYKHLKKQLATKRYINPETSIEESVPLPKLKAISDIGADELRFAYNQRWRVKDLP